MSKAFAWYGFFTVFDFPLVSVVDFADQDTNEKGELVGDIFKLYNYFQKSGSSGFVGYFLTFIAEFFILIVNLYLFYYYIVFVHHDSKISDIYLRITGKGRNYFIPEDNELSYRLLKHSYIAGEINQNRIIANKLDIWHSDEKREFVGKLLHFYQFGKSHCLSIVFIIYMIILYSICKIAPARKSVLREYIRINL